MQKETDKNMSATFAQFGHRTVTDGLMVKAIAQSSGAKMPGFAGYVVKYAIPVLLPIFVLVWLLFL